MKKQYDEVIVELDECIAALEVVEKEKMNVETENLELKHRIKTMKARFPEGLFATLETSQIAVSKESDESNEKAKIHYATNSKGINRNKLSAPLSPGLMSRISNIANRTSHQKGNKTVDIPKAPVSPTSRGSKPSDLLRLADLS